MNRPERAPVPEVHSITGAPTPHSDDLDGRVRRYLISMAVRTICVVLAVVVEGPLRWVFVAGAVLLPYVAVVMANAVGERRTQGPAPVPEEDRLMLVGDAEPGVRPVIILRDGDYDTGVPPRPQPSAQRSPDTSPEQVIRRSGEQPA